MPPRSIYPRLTPSIRVRIFGRLVKMLTSGGVARRARAADALVEAGAYAAPTLRYALLTRRRPAFQARVAELLGRLGPSLAPESRQEVKLVLRIAIIRGKDEGFLLAALRALEALEPGAAAEEIRRLLAKVQRAAAGGAPATGPPEPAGR